MTNYFDFYSWKGRITTHPHLDYLLWKALLILIMPTITILIDENKKLIFNILALKICMTNTYLCTTTITCDLSMVFLVEFLYVPHHPINVSTLVYSLHSISVCKLVFVPKMAVIPNLAQTFYILFINEKNPTKQCLL